MRRVVVTTVNGDVQSGALESFANGSVVVGGLKKNRFAASDLLMLQWTLREASPSMADPVVLLAGGDRLALRPESMNEESLTARWVRFPAWPAIKLPLEAVRGMVLSAPVDHAGRARLVSRVIERKEPQDLIVLNNGDTVTGQLLSLDGSALKLKAKVGETSIDLSRVRAVGFNPELTGTPRRAAAGAVVTLADGSFLVGTNFRLAEPDKLAFQTQFGAPLEIPLRALVSLQFFGGRVTFLSDLEPAAYKFQPFVGLSWPLRRDASLLGGVLRVRGTHYAKGLGVHSQSEVTYRLDGSYRRFQATIGIDDETGGKGSVIYRVLLDGKPVYESQLLTGTSKPLDIEPIDVQGAKSLTLCVDFGTLGDIQDHADWCNARLLK